jgi:outer membrane receptor protein involved in Fe transport
VLFVQVAVAEEEVEEVLLGVGTATAVGDEAVSRPGEGTLAGRVFDAATGQPLERVTVLLKIPAAPGALPQQEVQVTDADGAFEFASVPPGRYDITYVKAGYRNSTMTDVAVRANRLNRADFPLPPLPADASGDVLQLEEFVVEAETAAEMMASLETRLESDQLLNIMSAEDFSKFAAGDVAEALERVAGVNIVEGEFAIIRGLEDRYSSVLYNGAIIPSPDPDRQSVQLDLFPSEVVGSLTVTKSFSPDLPGNSSGGSIDILTHHYPEEIEFSLKGGTGFNDNAKDRFLSFDDRSDVDKIVKGIAPISSQSFDHLRMRGFQFVEGNPVGVENEKTGNWIDDVEDVLESDFVARLGGRKEFGGREFRFKGVASKEKDYTTAEGYKNSREPRPVWETAPYFDFGCFCMRPGEILRSGDLAFGELNLSDGLFEVTISEYEEQRTGFAALGFDLDDAGNHKIDASVLWREKSQEIVELRENGSLPNFDYTAATELQLFPGGLGLPESPTDPLFADWTTLGSFIRNSIQNRDLSNTPINRGALAWGSFLESATFQRDRELRVFQMNGDHNFDPLPGLHFSWAINRADTTQDEVSLAMKFFFEPCGFDTPVPCPDGITRVDPMAISAFPPSIHALGPGSFVANNRIRLSANSIDETSKFARLDLDYETEISEVSRLTLAGGVWWERASREVDSAFLDTPQINRTDTCITGTGGLGGSFACLGETPLDLGRNVFDNLGSSQQNGFIPNLFLSNVESTREIDAWHARGKLTLWEKLDLLGGVRREKIFIETLNDPYVRDPVTGEINTFLGGPISFPSRYLLFDRFDNPFIGEVAFDDIPGPDATFNDQLVNTGVVPGPCVGDDGSVPGITCVDFQSTEELAPFLDGEIDERRLLPSVGITFRPIEGLTLRGVWSETVARPSFRELGFYPSVEPGTDDITVGNPALRLSDVESWDARIEYTWGYGDLVAASYFDKTIELPIESIVIRDPANFQLDNTALIRTFFNNPNTADLRGFEVEARKNFDFLHDWWSAPEWFRYLSIGGNYTWIDAEVARTEAELARADIYFRTRPGDVPVYTELESTRRLFGQPEWIANADITFDHPDWGTKITFAWFAISDVLDAAGSANIGPAGQILGYTLDRYTDSFDEFRIVASQTFQLPKSLGEMTFKFSVKNLTDSERRIIYDTSQTSGEIAERELKKGRDYDVSLTWTRSF